MEVEDGGSLSEIYQRCKRLLIKTRDGLEKLERLEYSSANRSDLPISMNNDIHQIQSMRAQMESLSRAVPSKSHRDLWKRKVEQVAEEAYSLKESVDKYETRIQKRTTEARERAELLGRDTGGDSCHVLRIFDEEAQAMHSVRNSALLVEEMQSVGVAIVSKYAEQREHLKRAQRKALDVLNAVGLSNSILRLIERRHRVDGSIKYAGMLFTIIILIVLWWCS